MGPASNLLYEFNIHFGYPLQWTLAKMFTIYKKGPKHIPGNYRGISVMVALSKLYDSVLNKRLTLWFKPDQEQAGACQGRGCAEQLLILRLLIDLAKKTRKKLYIAFID
eukprot:GHVU01078411.1.p1 GENE.GHVU01078411.1~~GHVU01078411.1.p1  ORF type:complete len:109 (+),score=4.88 GHVU01078411.1:973-1299(+)